MDLWSETCAISLNENSKICMYHLNDADYIELPQPSKRARLMPKALPSATPTISVNEYLSYPFTSGKFIEKVFIPHILKYYIPPKHKIKL